MGKMHTIIEDFNIEKFKYLWIEKEVNTDNMDEEDKDQLIDEIGDSYTFADLINVLSLWSISDIEERIERFIDENLKELY